MEPIIKEDLMEGGPIRRTRKLSQPDILDNIVKIFSLPRNVLNDRDLIRLVTETDFPIYNYTSPTNSKENIYPLPSFGLIPMH
jgi:hypothetical protein